MRRRQPDAVTGGPPEVPDLGPMPVCGAGGRTRAGLAYPDSLPPARCSNCADVQAFNQGIEDYCDALAEWRDRVGDLTPLEIVRHAQDQRCRVPDAPICHAEFP